MLAGRSYYDTTLGWTLKCKMFRVRVWALRGWVEEERSSSIVWRYGIGYFCFFCQMAAGWIDCDRGACCLFVSFGLCIDMSLHWYHWCSVLYIHERTYIHGPQRMNATDFSDPQIFCLAPLWDLHLFGNIYWMDCNEMLCRYSQCSDNESQ